MNDNVNHPQHYTDHPSGIECIEITRHMNFNLGNVIKYVWRDKDNKIEDLKKARFYIDNEIERLESKKKRRTRGLQSQGVYHINYSEECKPINLLTLTK